MNEFRYYADCISLPWTLITDMCNVFSFNLMTVPRMRDWVGIQYLSLVLWRCGQFIVQRIAKHHMGGLKADQPIFFSFFTLWIVINGSIFSPTRSIMVKGKGEKVPGSWVRITYNKPPKCYGKRLPFDRTAQAHNRE